MATLLPWLEADDAFPDPRDALADPPGLLAAGGDLSPARLLTAYRAGIFPWFSDDQPILWWSPDPRCVIAPDDFRPSRSLRQQLRRGGWQFSVDRAFAEVIAACAAPRAYTDNTWITADIRAGYEGLHRLGHAHSVEVWHHGELAGGLYGVAAGGMFCGESMFSRRTDASKLAFWALMTLASAWRLPCVDCQLVNDHLLSLGAGPVPRDDYLALLRQRRDLPAPDWSSAAGLLAAAGFPTVDFTVQIMDN